MIRVAFVDFCRAFHDRNTIYYLSAHLKNRGVDVRYINERRFTKALDRIKEIKPDLLLYSALYAELPTYIAFDRYVKEYTVIKSLIGGPGPTFYWGFLNRCTIDALCVGEGEYALEEFLDSGFVRGKNIICQGDKEFPVLHPLIADLDSLAFPDRDIVYEKDSSLRNLNYKMFLSGRGCPYHCTYCFNSIYNRMFKGCGKIVRRKSVRYLIEEIKLCSSKYPTEVVIFQDDIFIYDKEWLREFCNCFRREIVLPFTCNVRANLIDEETVKFLKEGGCIGVNWSIESGQEEIRNRILKRNMSNEEILETGRLLNKYEIPHRIGNLLGIPGEKYEDMIETLRLNIKIKPYLGFANIFVPFPNLELTKYALDNGYLCREVTENIPKNYSSQSVLSYTREEHLKIQKLTFLFPYLVNYPSLFNIHYLRKIVFALPKFILKYLYALIDMTKMARLYTVKATFQQKLSLIQRYFWNL